MPLSPVTSTVLGTGATRAINSLSRAIGALVPTSELSPSSRALQRAHLRAQAAALDGALDLVDHPLHRLRLVDESRGAEPHGLDAPVEVAGAGVDDHRHLRPPPLQGAEHLEAVHPRHLQVEDDAVHRLAAEPLQRPPPVVLGDDLVSAEPRRS